jgi:hypothetical protein
MMASYDLDNRPGLWRAGQIFVRDGTTGEIVYEGAELDQVPGLMAELVADLNDDSNTPPTVKAAMAHLNLVMIHPFRDGNGLWLGVCRPWFSLGKAFSARCSAAWRSIRGGTQLATTPSSLG